MWLNFLIKLSSEEPSLWEELWEYIMDKYFSVQPGRYEYINLGTSSIVTMQTIILGLFIGVIIAAAIACYNKNRLGAFVRAIVKNQCLWPEKAMTLEELGFARNSGVKASLRSRNQLGRIVHCIERDAYLDKMEESRQKHIEEHGDDKDFVIPEYRIDFASDHFYIPDEEHYRAEIRYDNQGSGWRSFLLVLIISIVGASLMCFLLPDMLQLVDNLIGILSENDQYLH